MRRATGGFALVELMTVLAVVAVLAALALPAAAKYQLNARRSELQVNVVGIDDAQTAFHAAMDVYVVGDETQYPDGLPGKSARAWVAGSYFDTLGWRPDGEVRGSYRILAIQKRCNASFGAVVSYYAQACSNLDAVGQKQGYGVGSDAQGKRIPFAREYGATVY